MSLCTNLRPLLRTAHNTSKGTIRTCTRHRLYHSYEHPAAPSYSSTAESILSKSLPHIPTHGFSSTALQLGAKDAGYQTISTNLFPRGAFDLVMFYLVSRRLALKGVVNGEEAEGGLSRAWEDGKVGVGGRVRSLILERLRLNAEAGVVQRWPEALALMAQPTKAPPSIAELGKLSDEIWFLAGDTSVDTSWYTKRASLAAIYAAAEVYQTQDSSAGFAETERFVDARLGDLRGFEETVGSVSAWVGFQGRAVVNVLRSRGVRI